MRYSSLTSRPLRSLSGSGRTAQRSSRSTLRGMRLRQREAATFRRPGESGTVTGGTLEDADLAARSPDGARGTPRVVRWRAPLRSEPGRRQARFRNQDKRPCPRRTEPAEVPRAAGPGVPIPSPPLSGVVARGGEVPKAFGRPAKFSRRRSRSVGGVNRRFRGIVLVHRALRDVRRAGPCLASHSGGGAARPGGIGDSRRLQPDGASGSVGLGNAGTAPLPQPSDGC